MDTTERRYGMKARQLSHAFERVINANCAQMDLTCSQGMLLRYLSVHRDQPVFAKDIEQHFSLTHPTVSGLLQRLESKGFITILPDQHDRRCKQIFLTQRALDNHESLSAAMMALNEQLTAGFSQEEQDCFWTLLCRAVDNVEQYSSLSNQTEKEASL